MPMAAGGTRLGADEMISKDAPKAPCGPLDCQDWALDSAPGSVRFRLVQCGLAYINENILNIFIAMLFLDFIYGPLFC